MLSAGNASLSLSLSLSPRAWIHYGMNRSFSSADILRLLARAGVRAAIDLVFSDVTIKHLMSRCVSKHFDDDRVSIPVMRPMSRGKIAGRKEGIVE